MLARIRAFTNPSEIDLSDGLRDEWSANHRGFKTAMVELTDDWATGSRLRNKRRLPDGLDGMPDPPTNSSNGDEPGGEEGRDGPASSGGNGVPTKKLKGLKLNSV